MAEHKTARERYQQLTTRRQPFLDRARMASALTIPTIQPPEGHNGTSPLPQPNQGFAAQAVLTLSNRVASTLMPPGQSMMQLTATPEALIESGMDDVPDEIRLRLGRANRLADAEIERKNWRQATNLTSQLLVVTGNAVEQILEDNTIKVYRLDQFVVSRDPSDQIREMIICESMFPDSLSDDLRSIYEQKDPTSKQQNPLSKDTVELYTVVSRKNAEEFEVYQEFMDTEVPKSRGTYKTKVLPFNHLRWSRVPAESYGRGKVEEHIADIQKLDGLSKSLSDGAAMASRNVTMIRPGAAGGINLMRRHSKARNGEYIVGNPEDVELQQFQNVNGIQIVNEAVNMLHQQLGQAFLLTANNTRDAERVTATEVRMAAQEIDNILGGVFSTLSVDMSLWRVRRLLMQMQDQKKLPDWPEESIEPFINTGLEALGRGKTVESIGQAMQMIASMPEQALERVDWNTLLTKMLTSLDLPAAVKTEEEVQQERQQQMQEQAMAQGAGGAAAGAGEEVGQQAAQQAMQGAAE